MSNSLRVVAAVFSQGDRVLACRRRAEKTAGGKWEFPGGKVEPGETDQQALARELAEELGLRSASIGALVSRTVHAGDPAIELACYWVDTRQLPTQSTDHDAFRWTSVSELDELDWADADRAAVATLHELALRSGDAFGRGGQE